MMFQPILSTPRLTLTLFDACNEGECNMLESILLDVSMTLLGIDPADASRDAKKAVKYYSSHGRIYPSFLHGHTTAMAAVWMIHLGPSNLIGPCIGFTTMLQRCYIPDQGWVIIPEYRGRGYATEAAREVLRYFREEPSLNNIMAPTHPTNHSSKRVAQKIGYITVGRGLEYQHGSLLDLNILPGAMLPPQGTIFTRFAQQ